MKHDLQTESIWSATARAPQLQTFKGNLDVDVAIVGAGITGMTAAALLKNEGLRVAVIERAEFGQHGTTHRTSAHLTCGLDQNYNMLIRRFGLEKTRTAVAASMVAIDLIESLARELKFDNEFRRVDGYQYTEKSSEIGEMEDDCEAAQRLGLEVTPVDEIPLGFPIQFGYRIPNQAQFHPLKHIFGLANFINGDGSHVFHKSAVREYEEGNPCTLTLDEGTITAREIILATHTPMGLWPTLQTRLVPYHSYCIAARLKHRAPAGLFWDNADPYNYIRRFEPSDEGEILIIGGADTKTGQERDTYTSFEQMEYYARQRFDIASIEHYWSDQFFEPADGLPYIGRAPMKKRIYLATGFSGTGLTYGTASAIAISDLILYRKCEWLDAFSPSRVKPIASAKHVAEEAAATVQGLITDRFFKAREDDVSAIERGDGKIISSQGKRLAVYRDDDGALHAFSPTCTHMGCMVEFNRAEKHWDCKCHGSLFKADDGEPFSGPATKPLARQDIEAVVEDQHALRGPR